MKKLQLVWAMGMLSISILVACGGGGGSNSDAPNALPQANAGADQSVPENTVVVLDGTASSDPENAPLTYVWSQVSGSIVVLSSSSIASPQFTAPDVSADETLIFQLVVNDGNSDSAADLVNIDVLDQTNQAPTADAGADQAVTEGSTVTLDGTNSNDPEGQSLSYAWLQTSGTIVTLDDSTAVQPQFSAPSVTADETLVFQLVVNDGNSDSAADLVNIDVLDQTNQAPTADAGADQAVTEGSTVTLDGTNSNDPEGQSLSYAWLQTSGTIVTLDDSTAVQPQFSAPSVTADETLVFQLIVNDGNSNSLADFVNVDVSDQPVATSLNLPETGQQDCFDALGAVISCIATGQDGDIRAGQAWPNPRFTDLGDGSLLDELTEIIWLADGNLMPTRDPGYDTEGDANDGIVSWQTALDYIKKLNAESYLGFQDWRLPNRNELISLAQFNEANSTNSLQAAGFSNYSSYWSSTTQEIGGEFAWAFNVINGFWSIATKTENHYLAHHVVAVRSGNSMATSAVAATGQTTCFDSSGIGIACAGTGQDGELQVGVGMPNPRFVANADTSITDQMTGLIWESDPNVMISRDPSFDPTPLEAGAVTWQLALDYINKLNSENHLGYSDWRLPNVLELLSLFNSGEPNNSAWLSANGFGVLPFAHWSSTTNMGSGADLAWGVQLSTGKSAVEYKTSDLFYVWPVRGGN